MYKRQVSESTKDELDQIPWSEIIGMRNQLVHGYFDINVEIVWNTVVCEMPKLKSMLEAVL